MPEDPAMEAKTSVFFSILVDDLMSFCWMNRGGTKSPTTPEGAMVWFSYDNYHFQTLDFGVVLVFLINISGCF